MAHIKGLYETIEIFTNTAEPQKTDGSTGQSEPFLSRRLSLIPTPVVGTFRLKNESRTQNQDMREGGRRHGSAYPSRRGGHDDPGFGAGGQVNPVIAGTESDDQRTPVYSRCTGRCEVNPSGQHGVKTIEHVSRDGIYINRESGDFYVGFILERLSSRRDSHDHIIDPIICESYAEWKG